MQKTSDILWQDAQHQVLFDILDSLKAPGAGGEILYRLRDYCENHFMLEERYMQELGFPGMAEHVEAHDRFRQEIDKLFSEDVSGDALFLDAVATFLTEWLKRHVFGIDKDLERFILDAGVS